MSNLAAQAGMMCQTALFGRFILQFTGREDAADGVRAWCIVESRAELNKSPEAAERWRKLLKIFDHWKTGGGKNNPPPFIMGQNAYTRGVPIGMNPFHESEYRPTGELSRDLWQEGWNVARWRAEHCEKR